MTPLEAISDIWDKTQSFYGIYFAMPLTDAQIQEVSEWAQDHYRMAFFTKTNSTAAIALGNTLKVLDQQHYCLSYHEDIHTSAAMMGMGLSIQNFNIKDGIKTTKFKKLTSVTPSDVGQTLANDLDNAGVNYYAAYGNEDNPIIFVSQGYAGGKKFFDWVVGLDWLRDAIETNAMNTFLVTGKVPQTEDGMSLLKASVARGLDQGVNNGLLAAGQWNGDALGSVETGDWLENGYYIYADKIANQEQAERETRQAPPIAVLAKGAGALHGADILITPEA